MQTLAAIVRTIDLINKKIGENVAYLLIPITFICAYEVVARYFFKAPTIWAWELNMQIWAFVVMLTGAYALLENQHVRVDVIYNMFGKRTKAAFNILTCLLIMLCMYLVIKYGFQIGMESFAKNERQATIWASPMWTIRLLLPIGGIMVFLQSMSDLIKNIFAVRGIDLLAALHAKEGE